MKEPPKGSFSRRQAIEARYTNYLQVGSSRREIILEFGQYNEGDTEPHIHTRLVIHPAYFHEFLKTLQQSADSDSE